MKDDKRTCEHLMREANAIWPNLCRLTLKECVFSPITSVKPIEWKRCPAYNLSEDLAGKLAQANRERLKEELLLKPRWQGTSYCPPMFNPFMEYYRDILEEKQE